MASRRRLHFAAMLLRIVRSQKPKYLFDQLLWTQNNYCYPVGSSDHILNVPTYRTTAFRGSFNYAATNCCKDYDLCVNLKQL